jgi:hypothetical protein
MLGGIRKTGRDPCTRERDRTVSAFECSNKAVGDLESLTSGTNFQINESVYTCPRTPFNRETKGLLHSENTLALEEYS